MSPLRSSKRPNFRLELPALNTRMNMAPAPVSNSMPDDRAHHGPASMAQKLEERILIGRLGELEHIFLPEMAASTERRRWATCCAVSSRACAATSPSNARCWCRFWRVRKQPLDSSAQSHIVGVQAKCRNRFAGQRRSENVRRRQKGTRAITMTGGIGRVLHVSGGG